jgi:hypothetical protein
MTTAFAIKVLLEIIAVLLLVFGYMHEDDVIEFEKIIKWWVRKKVNNARLNHKQVRNKSRNAEG